MTRIGEGKPTPPHFGTRNEADGITGSFNKVFLLQFDNRKELLARIPCPLAGNLPLSTASEAATMEYVRLRHLSGDDEFPTFPKVPKVLSWDSSFGNPAAWPYILCEYLPGVTFDTKWLSIEGEATKGSIHDVVMFERTILQESFSQHGSIFFAESVSEELRARPLYAEPPTDAFRMDLARRFRIGPTVNREWWRGPYGQITADRGPCTLRVLSCGIHSRVKSGHDFPTMISSAAEFQLRCLDNGIDHTSPFAVSTAADIPLIRRMLNICIAIAPLIAPRKLFLTRPVLQHPDLSVCNFIVSSEGEPKIQGIIDWQGAGVAPFFMQCQPASGMVFMTGIVETAPDGSPVRPANFDSMSAEEQHAIRVHMDLVGRYKDYYLDAVAMYPERREAWNLPIGLQMPSLLRFILRCIADGPMQLFDLLIKVQEVWHLLSDEPCPIDFSSEEKEACRLQHEEWYKRVVVDNDIANALGCMGDGWVSEEKIEEASQRWEEICRLWDENMDRPFPFFDGVPGPYLS